MKLHDAVDEGNLKEVIRLLDNGADIEEKDLCDRSPLNNTIMSRGPNIEVIKLLLDRGANINSALHDAASFGHIEIVKLFIGRGVDVNGKDHNGRSVLHCVSGPSRTEIMKFLLDNGADVNQQTKYGDSPLHIAIYYGSKEAVKLLLDRGADIYAKNADGEIAVNFCPSHRNEYKEIVRLLKGKDNKSNELKDIRLKLLKLKELCKSNDKEGISLIDKTLKTINSRNSLFFNEENFKELMEHVFNHYKETLRNTRNFHLIRRDPRYYERSKWDGVIEFFWVISFAVVIGLSIVAIIFGGIYLTSGTVLK